MLIVKPFSNNTRFATHLLFVFSISVGLEGREGMASRKLAKILCFPEKPLILQKYQTNKKIAIENKVFPSKDVLGYQAAQGFASTCMGGVTILLVPFV